MPSFPESMPSKRGENEAKGKRAEESNDVDEPKKKVIIVNKQNATIQILNRSNEVKNTCKERFEADESLVQENIDTREEGTESRDGGSRTEETVKSIGNNRTRRFWVTHGVDTSDEVSNVVVGLPLARVTESSVILPPETRESIALMKKQKTLIKRGGIRSCRPTAFSLGTSMKSQEQSSTTQLGLKHEPQE
ncbi:hypothetical protein K435DRAFT_807962 [Dendrothele bispora CBS 962.96]|uniref:Uncharacterized protein n=1 Tax=Dendrothele bispora (strain CBS 962.96) TaxID=1314807 RepID=A0A4S8L301_DENBC|nr:hypothetical protein K435DRAFT_807962 [Dendrothele bispora CBS 962.96]